MFARPPKWLRPKYLHFDEKTKSVEKRKKETIIRDLRLKNWTGTIFVHFL
jgi:hypothetical protein